jgi:predicted secreted protein
MADEEESNEELGNGGDEQPKEQPPATLPDERSPSSPANDWRTGITDEKLRNSVGKFTSVNQLVESYNHLGGRLKQAVFLPSEKATDEDIAKFRKSLGVPHSADDYRISPPEGKEYDDSDKEMIAEFAEVAFEHNIPNAAFSSFMAKLAERASELRGSVAEQIEDSREDAEEELTKEWGNDFDKNVQMATRASKAHGGDRFTKFLNSVKVEGAGLLGDHPEMVRFLAKVGSKSDEHDMVLQSTQNERATAQEQIAALHEKYPVDSAEYKTDRVQNQLRALYEKVYGSTPIPGGR